MKYENFVTLPQNSISCIKCTFNGSCLIFEWSNEKAAYGPMFIFIMGLLNKKLLVSIYLFSICITVKSKIYIWSDGAITFIFIRLIAWLPSKLILIFDMIRSVGCFAAVRLARPLQASS